MHSNQLARLDVSERPTSLTSYRPVPVHVVVDLFGRG